MEKKLIVRIANGLGNQLFLYATAYAFSKKLGYKLLVDEKSGFQNESRKVKYELNNFNISSQIAHEKYKFGNILKKIKRFLLKKIDIFSKTKNFLLEKKEINKSTKYSYSYLKKKYKDILYMEGYFQSEKYFKDYKDDILKEFSFKSEIINHNLELQKKITESNSVLIHIRQHAFSETANKLNVKINLDKSAERTEQNIKHNLKAVEYFKEHIVNPKFFIFSNDFSTLKKIFNGDEFFFVDKNVNLEPIYDFFLMTLCRHFIVSNSTLAWWAAWLSRNEGKICIRPPNKYTFSGNSDIIPNRWINI